MENEFNLMSNWTLTCYYDYHYCGKKDNVSVDLRSYDTYLLYDDVEYKYDWFDDEKHKGCTGVDYKDYTQVIFKRFTDKTKEKVSDSSLQDYLKSLITLLGIEDKEYVVFMDRVEEDLFKKKEKLVVTYYKTQPHELMPKGETVFYYKSKEVEDALIKKGRPIQKFKGDYFRLKEEDLLYGNHLLISVTMDEDTVEEVVLRSKIIELKVVCKEGKYTLQDHKYLINTEELKEDHEHEKLSADVIADLQMSGLYFLIDKDEERETMNKEMEKNFDLFIKEIFKQERSNEIDYINDPENDEEDEEFYIDD